MTTDQAEKVRENRLRRAAQRQGLILRKSGRRDYRALDYGNYWLIRSFDNVVEVGGDYGMTLDEVEVALADGGYAARPGQVPPPPFRRRKGGGNDA
jgi:hypothetical protein